MKAMSVIMLIISICGISSTFAQECLSPSNPYSLFGSKTLYRNVAGTLPRQPKGCTPLFVYAIVRHGARYPSGEDVEIQRDLESLARSIGSNGRPTLCETHLEVLRNWRAWTNIYNDKNITEYGANEIRQLAIRFKSFLPEILRSSPNKYRFTSTDKMRTIDSMHAFVEGFFNDSRRLVDEAELEVIDKNVDPLNNKNCPRFEREVADNPEIEEEYNRFIDGPEVSRMARKIARRLGVPLSRITNEQVKILYEDGCYAEQWVEATTTPWCRIFSNHELRLMEYASEIEDYPKQSYTHPIAGQQNCFLTKEIVNLIETARDNHQNGVENQILGRFRFVSSSNVITLATNMRLYEQEEAPTASTFASQRTRSFRRSKMTPSAANIAFLLYHCDVNNRSRYGVQTLWNEKLVTSYPACRSATRAKKGLCDVEDWLRSFRDFVFGSESECSQEEICA